MKALPRLTGLLAIACIASAAEPVVSAWIMAPRVDNAELRKSLPDVHDVIVSDDFVEVRSAGLSLFLLGPFQTPLTGEGGVRDLRFRLPRKPVLHSGEAQRIGPGVMGVFRNGVPLYNRFADASYLGRNIWHFDTVAMKDPSHPMNLGVLEAMIANAKAHAPLLGFALDGLPIYGPWGFENTDGTGGIRRMHSGYRLRTVRDRTRLPDGTLLTPSQYGPPFDGRFPLGTFAEDYEYKPDPGDLDESNGRFGATPEYPNGTYAYFLTTNNSNLLAFPYFMTDRFRGKLPGVDEQHPRFAHTELSAGKPVELRFAFTGAPTLEIVHERPVHLMIVSSDLKEFQHIHPQWQIGHVYAVTHIFTRPGKYRLFAQFTPAGQAEQLETFDIAVHGHAPKPAAEPAPPITATLRKPDLIRTGQDVAFTVELTGQPIEPYLGAWGHFVLMDKNRNNFIHAHPAGSAVAVVDPALPHIHGISDIAAGPPPSSVSFTTNFAQPGHYKLWAQFQVAGKPVAIPFLLDVTGSPKRTTPAPPRIPATAIPITVDSRGFTPALIQVKTPGPVTLAVTRATSPNCGSQIVFPSLNIKRDLPLGQTTLIELPALTGNIEFACGMGMFRGMIVGVSQE